MMNIDAYVVDETNAPFVRETLQLDSPGPGEVLVKIKAVAICHTDLNAQSGDMPILLPGVFGHEGAGIVEEVGEGVTNVAVSDHVMLG